MKYFLPMTVNQSPDNGVTLGTETSTWADGQDSSSIWGNAGNASSSTWTDS